jgi:8-oxo-dGTP diphosphatase
VIEKSALVALRQDKAGASLLMVKEEGDDHWLMPGGRLEEGETIEEALTREVREELSTPVSDVTSLGTVDGYTVDGRQLRMHLFCGRLTAEPLVSSEIIDLRWLRRSDIDVLASQLTPITLQEIFPLLARMQLW